MEFREFAETILFSGSLEGKIHIPPEDLTDHQPNSSRVIPTMPARPTELSFSRNHTTKAEFPKTHTMVDPVERGRVLHFFANHELLALELMAVALLRFPDAPHSFRRGIIETMKEEQKHLNLYIESMNRLGVGFGEIPVNDFFWHCLSSMKSPLDYVSGMSLTFEQANLDFSIYYRDLFHSIEDHETANVLNLVYEEEIGHVKHGLKWFQEWKADDKSLWEAYQEQLKLPLSPRRAKGKVFYANARERAGFDQSYIENLQLYSDSHRQQPKLFIFNSDCEIEVSEGKSYTPSKKNSSLMADLEILPMFLAQEGDLVTTSRTPRPNFLIKLKELGFRIPKLIDGVPPSTPINASVVPWGLVPKYNRDKLDLGLLYSKNSIVQIRKRFTEEHASYQPNLVPKEWQGSLAIDMEEITAYVEQLHQQHRMMTVLKSPYSAAGQGMRRVMNGQLTPQDLNWIKNNLRRHTQILMEPWFDRILDLSIQLDTNHPQKIQITRFIVDDRGQYRGHILGSPKNLLSLNHLEAINPNKTKPCYLEILKAAGTHALDWLQGLNFTGRAGVDAFICRGRGNQLILQPFSEINPRLTMGQICIQVAKRVVFGRPAIFMILNQSDLKSFGAASFSDLEKRFRSQHEVYLDRQKQKIESGILWLSDPHLAQFSAAVLAVGPAALKSLQDHCPLILKQTELR